MRLSPSPDENRPSLSAHLVVPKTRELSESEFTRELESVKRKHRGVKLAIAEAELEKDRVMLQIKRLEIGIAKVNLEGTKQDFLAAAHKLVEKRARAAIAFDNAASAVSEHRMNQETIREKIIALHLSVQEASQKNVEKADTMRLQGFQAKLTAR